MVKKQAAEQPTKPEPKKFIVKASGKKVPAEKASEKKPAAGSKKDEGKVTPAVVEEVKAKNNNQVQKKDQKIADPRIAAKKEEVKAAPKKDEAKVTPKVKKAAVAPVVAAEQKKAAPKKKAKDEESEDEMIEEKAPGQKYKTPDEGDGTRVFYESLYQHNKESKLAERWLMEYGCLTLDQAAQAFKKYKGK